MAKQGTKKPAKVPSKLKAVAKKSPRAKTAKSQSRGSIRIRMYNVGFGDAFLVFLDLGGKKMKMLFDCGSIASGGRPMAEVVKQILADCAGADGEAQIDVVVATHRHRDHVSGFSSAAWQEVSVSEVWMPWTEDPKDKEAKRIRDAQSKLALALKEALPPESQAALAAAQADNAPSRLHPQTEMLLNALSNESAMSTLHKGFKGTPKRRFLPEVEDGKLVRTFSSEALPGISIHVLGPSKDEAVISDMDPPQGKSYLAAREMGANPLDQCQAFAETYRREVPDESIGQMVSGEDRKALAQAGQMSDFSVATALDKAVNGTSLMLVLEVGDCYLLFPGDAQWGTWKAVLEDAEWRELLGKTKFYKVGHHGSHNATPTDFVESVIPSGLIGMASTLTRSQWPDIPRQPLLDALANKDAAIARSDAPDDANTKVFDVHTEEVIETVLTL